MTIEQLEKTLIDIAKKGISEYHLTPGAKAFIRENGVIRPDVKSSLVTLDYMNDLVDCLLTQKDKDKLLSEGCLERAYSIKNTGRFRLRFGRQRSSLTLVIFIKSTNIPSVEDLKIPEPVVLEMTKTSGLLIVTGETKSNKSTTIASLLKDASNKQARIITSVEDPIDYLLPHGKGIVNQMEVGVDIQSRPKGLKEAINNHSDIIYMSDVTSKEEWQLIFDAIEKGFFIVLSMNSNGVEAALDHMLFNFNRDEQPFIKRLISQHLNAIVYEVNLETIEGSSCSVYEVLLNNKAVRNMFLENKMKQLPEIFKAFPNSGIKSIDMAISEVVLSGKVDRDYGMSKARHQSDFIKLLNGVN